MMKGSTNTQQGSGSSNGSPFGLMKAAMGYMIPGIGGDRTYGGMGDRSYSSMGTKGSNPWANFSMPQSQQSVTAQPVNYQQTPAYNQQPMAPSYGQQSVAPSDAILQFLRSSYASGGAAKGSNLEDDIEAALRIARMIGELTKKL